MEPSQRTSEMREREEGEGGTEGGGRHTGNLFEAEGGTSSRSELASKSDAVTVGGQARQSALQGLDL